MTRLNGKSLVVNAELIRYIESTPDTMITLINGDHLLVRESLENVVELAIEYCRRVRVFKP
ncbi:MAG: flagellar FlbD family protein [Sedimentisphaerales bacterium]|nr:flagellar FlbD family protein [Sedimentisphaerales bacterium]